MSRIKTVIFDWAGTTVDYGSFAPVEAFLEVFRQKGIEPTLEEVRRPMGMLKIEHIRTMLQMPRIAAAWQAIYGAAFTEKDLNEMYASYETKLLSVLPGYAAPKPFVLETVNALRQQGMKIGSTTGYNDKMMGVVVPQARAQGYAPDYWCSPDSTEGKGRPYPYMLFENMKALGAASVDSVLKVGDTVSDILEGKNAGVHTLGVLEGSSEMGLTQAEYEALNTQERQAQITRVTQVYLNAGADGVILNFDELLPYMAALK